MEVEEIFDGTCLIFRLTLIAKKCPPAEKFLTGGHKKMAKQASNYRSS